MPEVVATTSTLEIYLKYGITAVVVVAFFMLLGFVLKKWDDMSKDYRSERAACEERIVHMTTRFNDTMDKYLKENSEVSRGQIIAMQELTHLIKTMNLDNR